MNPREKFSGIFWVDRLLLKTMGVKSPAAQYQAAKPRLLCQRVEDNAFT